MKTFSHYVHVDNGGYEISIVLEECSHIRITDGYFGYSTHDIKLYGSLTPENLREIGTQFFLAADSLKKA